MDPWVELARRSIERFLATGRTLATVPEDLPGPIPPGPAACFVSLHTATGELRGCMGTLTPGESSLALEIIHNAVTACSRDRRFAPVGADELAGLRIGVDVLSPLEPIPGPEALDPRRFGVVVGTPDGRRGVLLPDLPGVDHVEHQVSIACRKGGIRADEPYRLQRFTVERHG
jgi:AmmeMemoRadiSam system protein A